MQMKPFILLALVLAFLPIQACYQIGILPTATPLPLPTELSTTPLPPGSRAGGLEGIFISAVSIDGYKDERCYKLYRFYPDGVVLYANLACLEPAPAEKIWSEIDAWFRRENRDIPRGDYYLQNHRIWIRVVFYNDVYETVYLRSFQGEYCNDEMVLQEPKVRDYAGVPSPLTQPVQEYTRLGANLTENPPPEACHVAGYRLLYRPYVTIAGGQAEYRIQTDVGQTCVLQYIPPDGNPSEASGAGAITADSHGICAWKWDVGSIKGVATVIVTIDEISQEYSIELR